MIEQVFKIGRLGYSTQIQILLPCDATIYLIMLRFAIFHSFIQIYFYFQLAARSAIR